MDKVTLALNDAIANTEKKLIIPKGLSFSESQIAEAACLNAQRRLENLLQAKQRLENNTFGNCRYCKGEIPKRELLVYPEKIRCGKCIKRREVYWYFSLFFI